MLNSWQNLRDSNFQDVTKESETTITLKWGKAKRNLVQQKPEQDTQAMGEAQKTKKERWKITTHISQIRLEPALSAQRRYLPLCKPDFISNTQDLQSLLHLYAFNGSRPAFLHMSSKQSQSLAFNLWLFWLVPGVRALNQVFLCSCALILQLQPRWSPPFPWTHHAHSPSHASLTVLPPSLAFPLKSRSRTICPTKPPPAIPDHSAFLPSSELGQSFHQSHRERLHCIVTASFIFYCNFWGTGHVLNSYQYLPHTLHRCTDKVAIY